MPKQKIHKRITNSQEFEDQCYWFADWERENNTEFYQLVVEYKNLLLSLFQHATDNHGSFTCRCNSVANMFIVFWDDYAKQIDDFVIDFENEMKLGMFLSNGMPNVAAPMGVHKFLYHQYLYLLFMDHFKNFYS